MGANIQKLSDKKNTYKNVFSPNSIMGEVGVGKGDVGVRASCVSLIILGKMTAQYVF